jgi:hypothetical protein
MLQFDHVNNTLDLIVEKIGAGGEDPDEDMEGGGPDMKSLSGGEKSYATICLLLALWDHMAVPFRALDEFGMYIKIINILDVFMDAVNRKISMELMTKFAGDSDVQYIFITPQDMSSVKGIGGPGVRVHRMSDPERGQSGGSQTTLNFA